MGTLFDAIHRDSEGLFMYDLRQQLQYLIADDLVRQEQLTTDMHVKAVAHSKDVTYIVSKLYSPEYLNAFSSMRQVLYLTPYMLLVIDVCERGCGCALHPSRPSHMSLRWKDISFYSFQSNENNLFDIRINVTTKWSKGQSLDASKYRNIPFVSLLPAIKLGAFPRSWYTDCACTRDTDFLPSGEGTPPEAYSLSTSDSACYNWR